MELNAFRKLANVMTAAVAALFAGLAAVPAVAVDAVGTTSGTFAVTESGAASYNVPIRVAKGTAGLEPALSLTCNSQGSNGPLGVGWSLSGLSQITRGRRTLAQDTVVAGVELTNEDALYLDGQRLVLVSGSHGNSGAEYRTEKQNFSKIVLQGSITGLGSTFAIWTKTGLILEMGAANANAVVAAGSGAPPTTPLLGLFPRSVIVTATT